MIGAPTTFSDKDHALLNKLGIQPELNNPNSKHLLSFYRYLKNTLWTQLYWSSLSWAIAENFMTQWIFLNADKVKENTIISEKSKNLNELKENRWLDKLNFIKLLEKMYWKRHEVILLKSFIITMNLLWTNWFTQDQSYNDSTKIETWSFGSYCIWARTSKEITYYYILEFDTEWECQVKEYSSNSGDGWSLINPSARTITFQNTELY